jgi:glycosyltransferase involved in cell wall biosynthesis
MSSLRVTLTHVYAWPEVRRGAERYVHELGASLQRKGHRVRIISSAPRAHRAEVLGVPVRYLKRRRVPRRYGRYSDQVAFGLQTLAAVGTKRCDVWHAVSTSDAAAAAMTSRLRPGVRSIYTEAGLPVHWYRSSRPDHAIFQRVARDIDEFVCLSPEASRMLQEDYGRASHPIGAGVDLRRFAGDKPTRRTPVLLFPGSLSERRKNLEMFLEAYDLLRQGGHDVDAWLVGPGDPVADLSAAARRGLAAAGVVRTADSEEMPELYRQATVTVLPSDHEVFGLVVVESQASGTPAVVLDNEHGPAQLVGPDTGVRSQRTAAALAESCLTALDLAAKPATATRCREAASAYDWDSSITPELLALYEARSNT